MCIIVHKEPGIKMPSIDIMKNCFTANKDGAGILVHRKGSNFAEIHKGFMTFDSFKDAVNDLQIKDDDNCVLHFRISTAGGITRGNCHPFPISSRDEDLKSLNIHTTKALIHNGIIGSGEKDLSDTQLFIKEILASTPAIYDHFDNENIQKLIETFRPGNRYVLIDTDKNVSVRLGTGWLTDPETKLHFSNSSYKPRIYTYSPYASTYGYSDKKNSTLNYNSKNKNYSKSNSHENANYLYKPNNNYELNKDFFDDLPDNLYDEYSQLEINTYCPHCKKTQTLVEVYDDSIYMCKTCKGIIHIDEKKRFDPKSFTWKNY